MIFLHPLPPPFFFRAAGGGGGHVLYVVDTITDMF